MRIYDKGSIDCFVRYLKQVPDIEEFTNHNNPYVYFAYRRHTDEGTVEYGFIYKNKRGRFTLVHAAIDDWNSWI